MTMEIGLNGERPGLTALILNQKLRMREKIDRSSRVDE